MTTTTKNGNGAAHHEPPKDWAKIQTDRPIWKAERGKGEPIQGYVLGLQDMPPSQGKVWRAFIIKLTAPTKCTTRDGKEIVVAVGEEVLAAANHKMLQHLGRAACHPRLMFEVWVKPDGQTKTNAGAVINFEMRVNPTPVARDGHQRMLALQGAGPVAPTRELPEHASASAEDDLPF